LVIAAVILGFMLIAGENGLRAAQNSNLGHFGQDQQSQGKIDGADSVFLANRALQVAATQPLTSEASLKKFIFTDIPADSPYAEALKYMKEHGIIKGFADGSFQPDQPVNRAEIIKILVVALGEPKNLYEHKNCFKDVGAQWFAPYGCYAKLKGWVKGYADGGYHPASDVTRAEALKMMLSAYGIPLETKPMEGSSFTSLTVRDWFAPYVWTAEKNGYTWDWQEHNAQNLHQRATRLEIATAVYKLATLSNKMTST